MAEEIKFQNSSSPATESTEKGPETNQPAEKKKNPLKALRTFRGDIDELMSKSDLSASSIVIAEQKRRERILSQPQKEEKEETKNKLYTILGGGLLFLGVVAIIIVAVYYVRSGEEVRVERQTKALISFSEEKPIYLSDSSKDQLIATISTEKRILNLPVNSVLYLNMANPDNSPVNFEEFLSVIAPRTPPSLIRAFGKEYMLGVYSFDTNELFLVIAIDDFAEAYAGMLKWEKTIVSDLKELFSLPENVDREFSFEDRALRNKDLRVVKDEKGNTILLYSFVDKNALIITTSENIFTAVLAKYHISQTTR